MCMIYNYYYSNIFLCVFLAPDWEFFFLETGKKENILDLEQGGISHPANQFNSVEQGNLTCIPRDQGLKLQDETP